MAADKREDKKALGISFMMMGVSLGITFGITLGWVFAPIGFTFVALGLVFMSQADDENSKKGGDA